MAITDHGPKGIGIGVKSPETFLKIKEEVSEINALFPEIKALAGAEAAVVSRNGALDLPRRIIEELDILIAGLHPYYIPESIEEALLFTLPNLAARVSRSSREKIRNTNTKALVETMHNYRVDFISHPDLMMPVNLDELASACAARETALELNTGHHYNKENIIRAAARQGAKLVINSDAHFPETVGETASGAALAERLRFPAEMVLNAER